MLFNLQDGQVLDNDISSYDTAERDTLDYLESRAVELSEETSMLSRELRKLATKCMELNDANAILMDELRQMCGSSEIEILEAINPNNNPQTDDEWSSQSTVVTKSESSSQ
ncbi:hypothetical protein CDL12_18147 [Handroanthus impetiginosus]|uniref:Uncharacterized protein n=1 Tax=Handroanthus impetiginosus TaxID=429701 RepID=A0A2G9GW94_9LAMI|nr:hypothetical protein CDL12_18147 [Handroanthus impetiginosus]